MPEPKGMPPETELTKKFRLRYTDIMRREMQDAVCVKYLENSL